jgi:superfamily II DNA or RNA helicase
MTNSPVRNAVITTFAKQWASNGLSTLVQFQRLEHGRELTRRNGGTLLQGSTDRDTRRAAREAFNAKHLRLLSASRIFDEGVDLPAMDRYILADPGKNYRRLVQRIGRAARARTDKNEVIVLDPQPTGHPKLDNPKLDKWNRMRLRLYETDAFTVETIK